MKSIVNFKLAILLLAVIALGPVALTSAPAAASSNIYYVALTGNDSNPGTSAQPWRTIQKAANSMLPGDSVTVLAGSYASERVRVTRSGGSSAPITFQAQGTVIMQGFTILADFISVKGFEITDTPDNWQDGVGIFVQGSNCVIQDNYIHYATWGGILLFAAPGNPTQTSNCIVRNNRLYRNSQVGIDVSGRNHLIEGNEVWGTIQYHPKMANPPSWVDADGIHFGGSGHTFRKNYIHDIRYGIPENVNPHIDCFQTSPPNDDATNNIVFEQNICDSITAQALHETSHGFMIRGASNLVIRNNILRTYSGINVNESTNVAIVNNVLASDLSMSPEYPPEGISVGGTTGTTMLNNIFYNIAGQIVWLGDVASLNGMSSGDNLAYRSDGKPLWTSSYPRTGDQWGVNPLFVNASTLDYHLQARSPAIDAGRTVGIVTNDFASILRPQGRGYDIGAYESTGPGPVYLPLISCLCAGHCP